MDKVFIEQNQIVERYLAGKLPFKGKRDFEQFCKEHPELLEEIRLSDHLHAGMQLLEESGLPAGWKEPATPWWRRPELTIALGGLAIVMLAATWVLASRYESRGAQLVALEQRLEDGPLTPPSSTRTLRIVPSRSGPAARPNAIIAIREMPELVELKVDMGFARHTLFKLTVDKKDQARAGTIYNLLRDSNGELRFVLNTSGLRPGDYDVVVDGVGPRSTLVPVAWMRIRVTR